MSRLFMSKLIYCRGLPGSGKSFYALEQVRASKGKLVRVNRDDLREMLHDNIWDGKREWSTVLARNAIISALLNNGTDVICDDTNLSPQVVEELEHLAKNAHAGIECVDFTDVDLKTCIKRDLARSRTVGEKVITDMYDKYLRSAPNPDLQNPDLPHCIIVDMDGTLAKIGDRGVYEDQFADRDILNVPVLNVVEALTCGPDVKLIIMSGRDEGRSRDATFRWLNSHSIYPYAVHMRPAGDVRHDAIIKKELYMEHIAEKFYVELVLDDRDSVVDLWRRDLGLPCFQVEYGNF